MDKIALLHWSAPYPATNNTQAIEGKYKNKDMHLPLYQLKNEQIFCQHIMDKISAKVTHVIEVFNWQGIEESFDFLEALLCEKQLSPVTTKI